MTLNHVELSGSSRQARVQTLTADAGTSVPKS
jgi:hypothetical protein